MSQSNFWDILVIVSVIATIISFPLAIREYVKLFKEIKNGASQKTDKNIWLILSIITIGFIAPLLLIITSFSLSGLWFWVLQVLSWFTIVVFMGLVVMLIKVNHWIKKANL